jgi:CubicO group peptidase (beta-lactamase class C family)
MKNGLKLLLTTVLVFAVLCLFAIPDSVIAQDEAEKIDELMQLYHEYGQFNGSVLVAESGEITYKKGFGLANMEWNMPNEPDTKFRIASVSKQFTAMLIMQLVQEKKIKLKDKITDYLLNYRKDTGDKITIHHLLTHTSGIPNFTNEFWDEYSLKRYTVEEMVENFCSGDLEFEPGSTYRYSNSGYYLLGAIIEKVAGKPFEQVLQERILEPVGMHNSGIDKPETLLEKRAAGYYKTIDGFVNVDYILMPNVGGAGAMYSTVEDLYLWDQALYTNKLLSQKYKKIMFKPFLNNYAYGWGVGKMEIGSTDDSTSSIGHTGYLRAFNSRIVRLIDDKHLIVLCNNTGTTRLREMVRGIAGILYDKPYDAPKKSIADVLLATIKEKSIEAAIEQYHNYKENHPDLYDFGESELNNLGYQLLRTDYIGEAIEIFKLNVEVFPDAYNPYDSLGEAYMVKGEKELAIKNYAKSLVLNPNNTGAIEKLKKITGK